MIQLGPGFYGASAFSCYGGPVSERRRYERIGIHPHARKRMRQRKISRAQVERALQNPDRTYQSWGKLAAEGATAAGNTVFVYYVETAPGEALVLSVKRRRSQGGSQGGPRQEGEQEE